MIPDIYELIFCPPVEGEAHECETTPFISTCVSLSHLLVCCNSALNWIVYLLAGEKFRRVWCEVYLPLKCRPKPLGRSQTQATKATASTRCGKTVETIELKRKLTFAYWLWWNEVKISIRIKMGIPKVISLLLKIVGSRNQNGINEQKEDDEMSWSNQLVGRYPKSKVINVRSKANWKKR